MPTNHDETLLERYTREAEIDARMMAKAEIVKVPRELAVRLLDEGRRPDTWAAQDDLRAILAQPAADEQGEQQPVVYWVLFDAAGPVPYIKKSSGDGFLAFFDNEEDAKRAKRQHHGVDYKRVEYFRAPPAHPDAALVEAANAALKAIQEALEATYHNAYPECCGQWHFECCGSPVQAWDDRDQKIMDLLAPHEKALRAALAGKGGE